MANFTLELYLKKGLFFRDKPRVKRGAHDFCKKKKKKKFPSSLPVSAVFFFFRFFLIFLSPQIFFTIIP